jgi:glycosyltransferase involved in cell wall biosynthesis
MVKRVLMVAFHFPPMIVSSGIQRTLRFAQYLPQSNWEPLVLTAHPRAYSAVSEASLAEVPSGLNVQRVFAMDTARHLSVGGRYPRLLSIPDRWWSWWAGAVPAGLMAIRTLRPQVLWSTYPIATAHLIAYTLHRLTGIPWIADFRDPMVESDYPTDPLEHRAYEWIQRRTLQHCDRAVFTAPGALQLCAERCPEGQAGRYALIENGYDEAAFAQAEQAGTPRVAGRGEVVLLHSGSVYPIERDPRPFFAALAALQSGGQLRQGELRIVLRASGSEQHLRALIDEYGIAGIVTLEPAIGYAAALAEMLAADGLLLLQAASCNRQIPAKLYEYLRARRPVLALTDPQGDTAHALRAAGIDTIARLDSQADIARVLLRFVALLREGRAALPTDAKISSASREHRTKELAGMLDELAARQDAPHRKASLRGVRSSAHTR